MCPFKSDNWDKGPILAPKSANFHSTYGTKPGNVQETLWLGKPFFVEGDLWTPHVNYDLCLPLRKAIAVLSICIFPACILFRALIAAPTSVQISLPKSRPNPCFENSRGFGHNRVGTYNLTVTVLIYPWFALFLLFRNNHSHILQ